MSKLSCSCMLRQPLASTGPMTSSAVISVIRSLSCTSSWLTASKLASSRCETSILCSCQLLHARCTFCLEVAAACGRESSQTAAHICSCGVPQASQITTLSDDLSATNQSKEDVSQQFARLQGQHQQLTADHASTLQQLQETKLELHTTKT